MPDNIRGSRSEFFYNVPQEWSNTWINIVMRSLMEHAYNNNYIERNLIYVRDALVSQLRHEYSSRITREEYLRRIYVEYRKLVISRRGR